MRSIRYALLEARAAIRVRRLSLTTSPRQLLMRFHATLYANEPALPVNILP
jgi:hypothetical protein